MRLNNADKQGYWDKEEFEDLIARALISVYEPFAEKLFAKRIKGGIPKTLLLTEKDMKKVQAKGCYFPPHDRVVPSDYVDVKNDGIPLSGCCAFKSNCVNEGKYHHGYLDIWYSERIQRLPSEVKYIAGRYHYVNFLLCPNEKGGVDGEKLFSSIDKDGKIYPAIRSGIVGNNDQNVSHIGTSAALNFFSDKKHLWNVQCFEKKAKATFGVYESQIQSLFYARQLPLSETGRKRPILHWVSSHRRRIASGLEVDIKNHLRGISEFEMNGTLFRISLPQKECK